MYCPWYTPVGSPASIIFLNGGQKGTLIYYVFDLLKLGEVDLTGEPLRKRKEKLKRLLKDQRRLLYVDHMENEGLAMFAGALALGLLRRMPPVHTSKGHE